MINQIDLRASQPSKDFKNTTLALFRSAPVTLKPFKYDWEYDTCGQSRGEQAHPPNVE